jgi:hypothetical protein
MKELRFSTPPVHWSKFSDSITSTSKSDDQAKEFSLKPEALVMPHQGYAIAKPAAAKAVKSINPENPFNPCSEKSAQST